MVVFDLRTVGVQGELVGMSGVSSHLIILGLLLGYKKHLLRHGQNLLPKLT